jgi:hypothetical protein
MQSKANADSSEEVEGLKAELAKAQAGIASLQALVATLANGDEAEGSSSSSSGKGVDGKGKGRDDDTHYFDSYAVNGGYALID